MESEEHSPVAWQPLTPQGVAAFGGASLKRLWLVQLFFALVGVAAVVWFVGTRWFPVIRSAIHQLPAAGVVRAGKFSWQGGSPSRLAETHFLSITIDLKHEGLARSPAHLQLEFGEKDYVILGILGAAQIGYPKGYVITCTREELEPWWGAWSPMLLGILALGSLFGLFFSWAGLSLVYTPAAWLVALFANRELRWPEAYKLWGAALMPGALFMVVVIVLYGLGVLDPIRVLAGAAAHLVVGWVYVIAAPFFRPKARDAGTSKVNPFSSGQPAPPGESPPGGGEEAATPPRGA